MIEKEYAVIVKRGINLEEVDAEIRASTGDGPIPNRAVDVANPRLGSKRMTHWMLTDEEAEELRKDERILAVEIPPDQRDDIFIAPRASQTGDFRRSTFADSDYVNWGLRRCIEETNVYNNSEATAGDYVYALDGTGVDVVIQDSGIQTDHPEFQDANGISRVQQINWYTESGIPGSQNANHYRDFDGHGSHCAGIAAGKTYGWAKNAQIYSQKLQGLEGPGDAGTGISITDAFDTIRLWHTAKTNGRPTVINMSWGFFQSTTGDPTSGVYQGTPWNFGDPGFTDDNDLYSNAGILPPIFRNGQFTRFYPNTNAFVDAEVDDMVAAGIHVFIAAGNDSYKAELVGGSDYDNEVTVGVSQVFYHRPGSPYSDAAFYVGAIDTTTETDGLVERDRIAGYSNRGPAVNIYAPGSGITSVCSTTNDGYTTSPYPGDESFVITNIPGTSMAAPQVCGIAALHLQVNPNITPAQMLTKLINDSKSVVYSTGNDTDYNILTSLQGSPNRMVFSRYGKQPLVISNLN